MQIIIRIGGNDIVYKILKGDCMVEMKKLEDESVDLILTDPPYGTIKGMDITKDWDVVVNVRSMFKEFERVLKPKGRAIIFGNNAYTQEVRSHSTSKLKYTYPLYWVKDSFGSPLAANVAPLSYVEDISVFYKPVGTKSLRREYMGKVHGYIGKDRYGVARDLGVDSRELAKYWYELKTFKMPTEEEYMLLVDTYGVDKMSGYRDYDGLEELYNLDNPEMTFNLPPGVGHVGNVFFVSNIAKQDRLHATQKPVELMKQLIEIFSNEGDVVLDAFMGSGTTGLACQNTGRDFIGIEMDDEYFELSQNRLRDNNKEPVVV